MLAEYYKKNKQRHVNAIRNKIKPPCSAEDIVQDAFVRAVRSYHSFDKRKGSFNSWFSKILHYTYLDYLKGQPSLGEVIPMKDWVDYNLVTEDNLSIITCIAKTDERYRELLTLFYIKGYSIKEVHDIVQLSETMIKQVCYRFRRALKEEWGIEI
jgi:RNA polymerase sigma-70 factor (ECF subfamily)